MTNLTRQGDNYHIITTREYKTTESTDKARNKTRKWLASSQLIKSDTTRLHQRRTD